MKTLEKKLRAALTLQDPGLVGCRRRNLWEFEEETEPSWRHVRGNALLALVGDKTTIFTPLGDLEVFLLHNRWLLQSRGGQWGDHWMEDLQDVWSLVEYHRPPILPFSRTVIVLHENQGGLNVLEIAMPDTLDPPTRVASILSELESNPPGRISKAGVRAQKVCRYCPFRTRCNATDLLHNQTNDWSPAYRKDLST